MSTHSGRLELSGYRAETRTCAEHGEYRAECYAIQGTEEWTGCPACTMRRLDAEREERDRKACAELVKERAEQRRKVANFPERVAKATFDNYERRHPDAMARALLVFQKFADRWESASEKGSVIFAYGRRGTGKTHLACATGRRVIQQGCSVRYETLSALLRAVKDTYSPTSRHSTTFVVDYYVGIDLLILDEITVANPTDHDRQIIYDILGGRYDKQKPAIILDNFDDEQVSRAVGDRTWDRLCHTMVSVHCDWPSYRQEMRPKREESPA